MKIMHVKNWVEFQHYKDRSPPWIKLQTNTFQNYEFSQMSDASKLLAICIWTLASKTKDGSFPADLEYIKNYGMLSDIKSENLKELIDQGFVIDASNTLADCKQSARPEERRGEAEKRQRRGDITLQKPDDIPENIWNDFLQLRKKKRSPLTETALNGIRKEAAKAGWTLHLALAECCTRGWQGFKAEWVQKEAEKKTGYKMPSPAGG